MKIQPTGIKRCTMNSTQLKITRPPLRTTIELGRELGCSARALYCRIDRARAAGRVFPVPVTSSSHGNYYNHVEFLRWYAADKQCKK